MHESVPVRCPACRREHVYTAPEYPCACGAPVAPALDRSSAPARVVQRAWEEEWVTVRCTSCGRRTQWPHPELGCPCGTVLRIPVTGPATPADPDAGADSSREPCTDATPSAQTASPAPPATGDHPASASDPSGGSDPADRPSATPQPPSDAPDAVSRPASPAVSGTGPRPPFRPITIRTARDAVTAAALYLRWLGYRDIRRADQPQPSGIGLAARGLLAQVDPSVRPASPRDVECLWLTAMSESAGCVYFSLAGYAEEARVRADALGVPLFVLDLTGTPQPVNALAHDLAATGA
ncbi:hypothetical protein [Streptomyces sp. V3I7]|uniref:hypothetical protein n=1 Tax=Streptomyces sp. V3I7 TaxID=3042278 RepID=UPI0027814374|nr:hypothetical protein [Streptomyces sp. V3I7]MDQ0993768.1 rRNA maturation protein Nop10 [Streptomyces sp. V3I7]